MRKTLFLLIFIAFLGSESYGQDESEKFSFPRYRIGFTPSSFLQRDVSSILTISQDIGIADYFNIGLETGYVYDEPDDYSTEGVYLRGGLDFLARRDENSGFSLGIRYVYKNSLAEKRGIIEYFDDRYRETVRYEHRKKLNALAFTAHYIASIDDRLYVTLGVGLGPGTLNVENNEDVEIRRDVPLLGSSSRDFERAGEHTYNMTYLLVNISYRIF